MDVFNVYYQDEEKGVESYDLVHSDGEASRDGLRQTSHTKRRNTPLVK